MVRRAGGASARQSVAPRRASTMPAARAALRACCLLLCLVAGTRQFSIKEFLVPKALEVGKDAELRCQYELGNNETADALYVKWWWTPEAGNADEKQLKYQRIAGYKAEPMHHDNTSLIEKKLNSSDDTIFIRDVTPMDSGTYECEVSNIEEIRQHEKLIVFSKGTGPAINYTLLKSEAENEDNMLLIECEAENVAPLPDMTVSFQGEAINISKTIEDTNSNGFYKIYANATVSTADVNEGEIRCELTYSTLEHPPYVDVKEYIPAGRDAPPATEPPEDANEPDPTHNSLQNPSDDGIRLHSSLALLTLAAVVTHLQAAF